MMMAGMGRKRGIFGAPVIDASTPGYIPPDLGADGVPVYKKPDTLHMIAGVIGDTLSTIGGGQASFLPGLAMQRQAQYQARQAAAKRAADFADFTKRHDYEVAHPKAPADDVFTRTLTAAGIDPASPQGQALYRQRADTLANPTPQWVPDGFGGGRFIAPGGAPTAAPPQAPVGRLTPMQGGAAPSGSRTFPIR